MTTTWKGAARACIGASALILGLLAGCGGGGGGGDASTPAPSANAAPLPAVTLSGAVMSGAGTADVSTFTGSEVQFDASGSKDPDGDPLTYRWTLVSKPAGSTLDLGAATAAQLSFKPDLAGTYVASVRVSDNKGAAAEKQATILVRANAAPETALVMKASYSAVPVTLAARKVTIGANILFDSAGSTDADGDVVTTVWDLIEKPAASKAVLTISNATARLATDAAGTYKVRARGTDPSGAYSETIYPIEATGSVPETVLLASITDPVRDAGANTVQASVGYTVALSGADSKDPDGGALSYAWTLVSKPAASAVALSSASGAFSQLVPDVLGDYVVKLVTTNPAGAAGSYQTTVSVKNRSPLASIGSNATPVALASGPSLRLPLNTTLTLRGTGSTDADGDTLTYAWTMVSKPAASTAALSATSGATVQLTTDAAGSYQVRLRVTDPSGAYSEQVLNIDSGNAPPVAMIDKSRITLLAGAAASASAATSYDDDGDGLTYAWAIDARPAGSSAAIAAPNAAQLAFTPDVAGTYVASVTVSDGKSSSMAYLTIKALSSITSNVPLSFVPLEARYSRGLDRFVASAASPSNALHIIDPFSGTTRQVTLPLPVKAFSLSADGKLAAVLHEGVLSLVDLQSASIVRSSSTGGAQTEALVTNAGIVYMVGQTGGQWVNPAVSVVNGRTGIDLTASLGKAYSNGSFYGTMRGVFAATKRKAFVMSSGLSPSDINYFTIDATSGAVTESGDSPYHGDYPMGLPLYLSAGEDLVFTTSGTFFRTDTLKYAGRLVMNGMVQSLSHSASADEAIVAGSSNNYNSYPYPLVYEASYHRFTGPLFLPDTDIALPLIGGQQSYGIGLFHSANDNHVALVQTGSATANAAGVKYYIVTR